MNAVSPHQLFHFGLISETRRYIAQQAIYRLPPPCAGTSFSGLPDGNHQSLRLCMNIDTHIRFVGTNIG